MDKLDDLIQAATDDWRTKSDKPMKRSAAAFIALGGGVVVSNGKVPAMIGAAVVSVVALTWYLWPSPEAPREVAKTTPPAPTAVVEVRSNEGAIAEKPTPLEQEITHSSGRLATTPPKTSSSLASPISPSQRKRLTQRERTIEDRLREQFRQAAAAAETDPTTSVKLFVGVARSYESQKNINHARYALLQARDVAASLGDAEQLLEIDEALARLAHNR